MSRRRGSYSSRLRKVRKMTETLFPEGCPWIVLVPSNNPEPTCSADMWRELECGEPVTELVDGWLCEGGHEHVDYCSARARVLEAEEAALEMLRARRGER